MRRSTRRDKVPLKERLVLSMEDAVTLSGFGLSTIYREMDEGRLIARKQGARTVILRSDFDAWLASLPKKPAPKSVVTKEQYDD